MAGGWGAVTPNISKLSDLWSCYGAVIVLSENSQSFTVGSFTNNSAGVTMPLKAMH